MALLVSSPALAHNTFVKLGAGLGIPYGGFGAAAEIGTSYVSVLGGVGSLVYGPGWSVGGRVYALPPEKVWRPHATVVYGATTFYKITGAYETNGILKGFGIYLGVDQDIGRPGGSVMTYGLGYVTHESLPAGLTESKALGSPVKILLGWNYRFAL